MIKGGIFDVRCGICNKEFGSSAARAAHERDKHKVGIVAAVTSDDDDDDDDDGNDGFDPVEESRQFAGHEAPSERNRWRHSDERLTILMHIPVDTDKLYHHNLNVAISYLADMRDKHDGISLAEYWSGYETMEMVFAYTRYETDREFAARQKWMVADKERAEKERRDEKAREARRNQWASLNREFGQRW